MNDSLPNVSFEIYRSPKAIARSTSTLLVPLELFTAYKACLQLHDISMPEFFEFLMKKYRHLGKNKSLLQSEKIKKKYQKKGQNLMRIDFVPRNEDWAELTCLTQAFGLSRCHTFVLILKNEIYRLGLKEYVWGNANKYFGIVKDLRREQQHNFMNDNAQEFDRVVRDSMQGVPVHENMRDVDKQNLGVKCDGAVKFVYMNGAHYERWLLYEYRKEKTEDTKSGGLLGRAFSWLKNSFIGGR